MRLKFRTWLLGCLFAGAAATAGAQSTPHAIGLHVGGSTIDLEYQYHFSNKNFLDVTAGTFQLGHGGNVAAVYNWNIKDWPEWCDRVTWKLWGGVGATVGWTDWDDHNGVFLGPQGTLGFGFTGKNVPFTFGVDYRPSVLLCLGENSGILTPGFYNLGWTLTYRF